MNAAGHHTFQEPASIDEAIRIQEQLRAHVIRRRTFEGPSTIGAVDCSYAPSQSLGVAGIMVYRYPDLLELSHVVVEHPMRFPYIPGLLAFRELPLILAAVEALSQLPDLLLVDGQGIAHPRRLGIASHLGVLLDRPTIGCAKSLLVGRARQPAQATGSMADVVDRGETIGALVCTRADANPLVVSIGHRIDLATAIEIVLRCCDGTRLPKPLREADRLVRRRLASMNSAPRGGVKGAVA